MGGDEQLSGLCVIAVNSEGHRMCAKGRPGPSAALHYEVRRQCSTSDIGGLSCGCLVASALWRVSFKWHISDGTTTAAQTLPTPQYPRTNPPLCVYPTTSPEERTRFVVLVAFSCHPVFPCPPTGHLPRGAAHGGLPRVGPRSGVVVPRVRRAAAQGKPSQRHVPVTEC